MRRTWIAVIAASVLLLVPAAVIAATGFGTAPVTQHTFSWRNSDATTSSTAWVDLAGLGHSYECQADPDATATLSVQLAGGHGPVEFRVLRDVFYDESDTPAPLVPGIVRIDTGSGDVNPIVTSFTFIQSRPGLDDGRVWVQWRSPTGTQQTLRKATLVVDWARLPLTTCK